MNVLLVLADDMRADLLPFMSFVNGVLRRSGTEYTSMRAEVPVCSPARAGMVTGQYAHRAANGVFTNTPIVDVANPALHSLPVWLAGVTCGMFGKYTIPGVSAVQPGWDVWRVLSGNTQAPYGYELSTDGVLSNPPEHQLDLIADEVETFVTTAAEPWFCWFAPTNPHVNTSNFGNNPQPETLNKFDWVQWPYTLLEDTTGKPSWIAALGQHTPKQRRVMQTRIRRQIRETYDLDVKIQGIHAALDAAGRLQDTLIIFVSDGGVFYLEQRLPNAVGTPLPSTKEMPYDAVAKVPCILSGPGVPRRLVYPYPTILQDVTATILEVFGATPSVDLDGVDLLHLLDAAHTTRSTLFQRQADALDFPDGAGIVTHTRKLIRWDDQVGTDKFEMYDLDTDPDELVNVANVPARLAERNALEALIDAALA